MIDAKCAGKAPNTRKDPEASDPWFPSKGQSANPGKIFCFTCPVRVECESYRDRTYSEYGMWAGVIFKRNEDKDDTPGTT